MQLGKQIVLHEATPGFATIRTLIDEIERVHQVRVSPQTAVRFCCQVDPPPTSRRIVTTRTPRGRHQKVHAYDRETLYQILQRIVRQKRIDCDVEPIDYTAQQDKCFL